MDLSSVTLPPVGEKPATLFVALELSKATWLVALHSPSADKVSLHRLAGGDTQELLTRLAPQGVPEWPDPHSDRPRSVSFPGPVGCPGALR